MTTWTSQTKAIIDKHNRDFNIGNYASRIKVLGGYDKYVSSLGLKKPAKVTTVSEFRAMVEYVMALMAIWGIDYYNGKTYWRWGQGSGTKATADAFRTSGKGKCASGDLKKILNTPTIVTTNCNYGVDTFWKACGKSIWSCDYDKVIKSGAKWVTKKADLKPGDMVHFWNKTYTKANWKHVAVVVSVEGGKVWMADFGNRFVKQRKPYHYMPVDQYTTAGGEYGSYVWKGVRKWTFADDTPKKEVTVPMLNGVDIASYQAGIDFGKVPADFVIIKATEGVTYVNPDCNRAFSNAKSHGKLLGLYHYASGGNAAAEADFFLKTIGNYVGQAILVLDWESGGNASFGKTDVTWCKTWLDRVYSKTGVRPLIYMSQSVTKARDWSAVAKNYGLWLAQYVVDQRNGYKQDYEHGMCGAWQYPAIWQYTSGGYLTGWAARLDLNVAYMDKAAWQKYAAKPAPAPAPKKEEDIPVPKTIKIGSKGKLVKWLQIYLGGLTVDGKFGSKTKAALIKWQKAKGVANVGQPDGVCGPKTWRYILKSMQ